MIGIISATAALFVTFILPRDECSVQRGIAALMLSVRTSVTLTYHVCMGWITSEVTGLDSSHFGAPRSTLIPQEHPGCCV